MKSSATSKKNRSNKRPAVVPLSRRATDGEGKKRLRSTNAARNACDVAVEVPALKASTVHDIPSTTALTFAQDNAATVSKKALGGLPLETLPASEEVPSASKAQGAGWVSAHTLMYDFDEKDAEIDVSEMPARSERCCDYESDLHLPSKTRRKKPRKKAVPSTSAEAAASLPPKKLPTFSLPKKKLSAPAIPPVSSFISLPAIRSRGNGTASRRCATTPKDEVEDEGSNAASKRYALTSTNDIEDSLKHSEFYSKTFCNSSTCRSRQDTDVAVPLQGSLFAVTAFNSVQDTKDVSSTGSSTLPSKDIESGHDFHSSDIGPEPSYDPEEAETKEEFSTPLSAACKTRAFDVASSSATLSSSVTFAATTQINASSSLTIASMGFPKKLANASQKNQDVVCTSVTLVDASQKIQDVPGTSATHANSFLEPALLAPAALQDMSQFVMEEPVLNPLLSKSFYSAKHPNSPLTFLPGATPEVHAIFGKELFTGSVQGFQAHYYDFVRDVNKCTLFRKTTAGKITICSVFGSLGNLLDAECQVQFPSLGPFFKCVLRHQDPNGFPPRCWLHAVEPSQERDKSIDYHPDKHAHYETRTDIRARVAMTLTKPSGKHQGRTKKTHYRINPGVGVDKVDVAVVDCPESTFISMLSKANGKVGMSDKAKIEHCITDGAGCFTLMIEISFASMEAMYAFFSDLSTCFVGIKPQCKTEIQLKFPDHLEPVLTGNPKHDAERRTYCMRMLHELEAYAKEHGHWSPIQSTHRNLQEFTYKCFEKGVYDARLLSHEVSKALYDRLKKEKEEFEALAKQRKEAAKQRKEAARKEAAKQRKEAARKEAAKQRKEAAKQRREAAKQRKEAAKQRKEAPNNLVSNATMEQFHGDKFVIDDITIPLSSCSTAALKSCALKNGIKYDGGYAISKGSKKDYIHLLQLFKRRTDAGEDARPWLKLKDARPWFKL